MLLLMLLSVVVCRCSLLFAVVCCLLVGVGCCCLLFGGRKCLLFDVCCLLSVV